jgi:hypothetical protein
MEDIRRGKQTNIPGDVASQLAGVNLSPPPAGAREKLPAAFSNLGKVDQAELDAALKTAKKQNASPSKIAEIKAADHTYNVKSLRRDITAAIKYSLPREITALNSPLTNALVNFNAQSDNYDKLSNNEQEAYLKANPDYAAQRIFWGELTTVPTLKNAQDASVLAKQYGIPLNLVPAFALTDKNKERIPSNESLWPAYFDYNNLPSSSYLAMSQSQVDAGQLPDKYLNDWQTYQKLKTDVAKSAFRNSHKEASKSTWRDDFRKKNPEFDKWLQENKDMKPLYTKTVTMRSGSGSSIRTTSIGSSGISAPARQKATVRKPSFKTASARRGLKIGTPRVARA